MKTQQDILWLLKNNKGFDEPEKWVEYAAKNNFQLVKASKLEKCPDCDFRSPNNMLGQFVYYSSLIKLKKCSQCGLIYSDTRIDNQIIKSHFENTYKDEDYFMLKRSRIFNQLAKIISKISPQGGKVLDVGGGKGHLLNIIRKNRPDLTMILNDISSTSCKWAKDKYEFETINGDINTIIRLNAKFDVIIMSDVIYYEPDLNVLWNNLYNLVNDDGVVIIRTPNKGYLIQSGQMVERILNREKLKYQDNIKYFNPEHLYVFSKKYLSNKLKSIGFKHVMVLPSEMLINMKNEIKAPLIFFILKALWLISNRKLILTPSFITIVNK